MGQAGVFLGVIAPLLWAGAALAQSFDACGTLERGVLTCWLLRADDGGLYVLNPNPAGWNPGERVRVTGVSQPNCTNFCQQSSVCVLNAAYTACSQPGCRADFDGSGLVSVQDIFAFLEAYFGAPSGGPSPPGPDFDQNGTVTVNDIFSYLGAYFSGCG